VHLVGEGYCSPEDIDRVLTDGLALRWAFIGPFQVAHLNSTAGVQGYYSGLSQAISRVQNSLRTDYPPRQEVVDQIHADLAAKVPVPAIPDRQKWRDRKILALRRHLASDQAG
jgi:L-gulonate 3-dehydrogenase